MRSGLPHLCSYDTPTGLLSATTTASVQPDPHHVQRSDLEVHHLRAEVAELKALLSKSRVQREVDDGLESRQGAVDIGSKDQGLRNTSISVKQHADSNEPSDPRSREPCGFYGRHSLLRFFTEVIQYSRHTQVYAYRSMHWCYRFHSCILPSKILPTNGSSRVVLT